MGGNTEAATLQSVPWSKAWAARYLVLVEMASLYRLKHADGRTDWVGIAGWLVGRLGGNTDGLGFLFSEASMTML